MSAKQYENPAMLSRVTAKNVGDVFLRHTVDLGRSFYRFVTIHACDGQTDRRDRILIARPRLHCMQRGKNRWEDKKTSFYIYDLNSEHTV